jgi:hypothetical protein
MFEVQGITMNRGDQLLYSFTHSINGINCDTPVMTYINQGTTSSLHTRHAHALRRSLHFVLIMSVFIGY